MNGCTVLFVFMHYFPIGEEEEEKEKEELCVCVCVT